MFTLFDIPAKRAALNPTKLAMVEPCVGVNQNQRSVTYAELETYSGKTATFLQTEGVTAGDRVAVLCNNSIAFFELLFACGKLGVILVPLNWRMPARELDPLIVDSAPTLLFYDPVFSDTVMDLTFPNARTVPFNTADSNSLLARRENLLPYAGRHQWPADDPWYLLYTSGTTGAPKAVIQTYGMALVNYINASQATDLTSHDHTLNFLPLFHTAGINLYTLPTLIAGGTVTVLPSFDSDMVIDLLASGTLSIFFGVPAVYQQLSLQPRFNDIDLQPVRNWGCGGAPLADALNMQYQNRGVAVCNGYGMTETGPTVFLMDSKNTAQKIGSVGKPQLLSAIRIVDEDGHDVNVGEVGEIWVAGPGITPGYWNKPKETAATFSDNGWLRTGDLGQQDTDGYYYVVGRAKEMFISGGENIYPAEVENVLCQHPDILEVAVVGHADEKWGEVGHAFILLKPGAKCTSPAPNAQDLTAFCRENLAAYKVPKAFSFVDMFPRTAAGKIQKHLLSPNKG